MLEYCSNMQGLGHLYFVSKVIKIGNSLGVIMPKPICRSLGIRVGTKVNLESGRNGTIIIQKVKS